jgi:multiple sugar transport system substrate-binding protein
MTMPETPDLGAQLLTRRALLGLGLGAAATVPLLAACAGSSTSGTGGGANSLNFLSTQFTPIEERQRFTQILKDKAKGVSVAYNPVDAGVFNTTITSQVKAGKVSVGLAGGLHGDLAPHAGELTDLDDLIGTLSDRKFPAELLTLAKLGGSTTKYVPWMQASYVMAVHKKALQWLPSGADVHTLTYDQLLAWAVAGKEGNGGKAIFGIPAGPKGLYHRFFQGYLLPSFTGGQISTFRGQDAVAAWQYMRQLWTNTAAASTNYDFMQEPLQRGEVLVAWDHVARLIAAPAAKPDDWLMVPAPTGPKGLGYLLVVAGIGIPKGAPNTDQARTVITTLTTSDTQVEVLRQNAFFPVVGGAPATDLPPAVALAADAIDKQQHAGNAILSLPPVGLGSHDGEVSQIFKDTFTQICLNGKPPASVLGTQAEQLNKVLDEVKVPCWPPDQSSGGQPCRVA